MMCDPYHMPMGASSNIYCNPKYYAFTVTSILVYILLPTCRLSSVRNTMKTLTVCSIHDISEYKIRGNRDKYKLFYLMNKYNPAHLSWIYFSNIYLSQLRLIIVCNKEIINHYCFPASLWTVSSNYNTYRVLVPQPHATCPAQSSIITII